MAKHFHTNIGPFMRSKNSTNKIMNNVVIELIPIILFAFYKNGIIPFIHKKTNLLGMFYPLIFIILTTITSFLTELLYYRYIKKIKGSELKEVLNKSFSIM